MEIVNNQVKNCKIAYIGGGSKGWAWRLMADLALENDLSGTISLYDIDEDAAIKNAIIGNNLSKREEVLGKWDYTVSKSLEEALTNADF
ncbi:MAG: alpha-glucosidase/alpha-galactosidase, partial [Lachnospirales bacterium]